VEKYIPRSTGKAFNRFEKFNEIISVATFLKRPETNQAGEHRERGV